MQTRRASAPGKIILSGEYAVVFGKRGIAIPSTRHTTVSFEQREGSDLTMRFSLLQEDPRAETYMQKILSALEPFLNHPLEGTLTIESTLPVGRGMGSSTAVVIATSRCILGNDCRDQAKQIEDAVNPGNSGLDFSVIWSEKPVCFRKGESPVPQTQSLIDPLEALLIDTGSPGETTPQPVAWMKERYEKEEKIREAMETIDTCSRRLLDGESLFTVFPDHHRAQVVLGVVPKHIQELIKKIEQSGGVAKVIGAGGRTGGGGMVLALHQDTDRLKSICGSYPLLPM